MNVENTTLPTIVTELPLEERLTDAELDKLLAVEDGVLFTQDPEDLDTTEEEEEPVEAAVTTHQ